MKHEISTQDLLALLDALNYLDFEKVPYELAMKLDTVKLNLMKNNIVP